MTFKLINRILLGLLMFGDGLWKLFFLGPSAMVGTIASITIFGWAPNFWVWVLILSEIVFGAAILANWKLKYTVVPPMVILTVAAFTIYWGKWTNFLLHLAVVSNYALLAHWKIWEK